MPAGIIDLRITASLGAINLATMALQGLSKAVDDTVKAFKLKAEIEQTNASIRILLSGVRDTGRVFDEAANFAEKYKLTQQETTEAILSSNQILRNSNATVEQTLSTLARLRILSPEQTIKGASLALKELQSGSITSLATRFEISRSAANKMKAEIQAGGDAVLVLSKYLDNAGVSMKALEAQTLGATGKMRELAQANERFALALGEEATGPGLVVLQARIDSTNGATRILRGEWEAFGVSVVNNVAEGQSGALAFLNVLKPLAQQVQQLSGFQDLAADSTRKVTQATLESADAADRRKDAAERARIAESALFDVEGMRIDRLAALNSAQAGVNAQIHTYIGLLAAAAGQGIPRSRELNDGPASALGLVGKFSGGAQQTAQAQFAKQDQARASANRLNQAQLSYDLSRARTSAQRIAVLQRELSQTTDQADRLRIMAQIEGERNSKAKGHTSELNKQLKLNENIYDSLNKQRHAQLDIAELTIKDRQERRKEDRGIGTANRIISAGRAGGFTDEQIAAAQDRLALIDVQRQQRALDISDKASTAGASLVNGKLFQSRPQGGAGISAAGTSAPLGPTPAGIGTATTNGGAPLQAIINIDGKKVAEVEFPYILAMLRDDQRAAFAAGRR